MVYDYFDKYTFICEMYDVDADEMVDLVLNFFPFDNSVQIIDANKGVKLLRRVHLPPLKLEMLQVGNIVNVFAKLIYIKDCAPLTKRMLFFKFDSTFALIKPCPPSEHGKIITFILESGFRIVRMKNGRISKDFAIDLYKNCAGSGTMPALYKVTENSIQRYRNFDINARKVMTAVETPAELPFYRIIIDYVTSGEVIGLELVAKDAVKKWRQCLGATDPADAAPGTLRALYGRNILRNVAHGCNTKEDAIMVLDMFFGYDKAVPKVAFRATFKDCTCCIIKPHALNDGKLGLILEHIVLSNKFIITALAMFSVKLFNAQEFYEVYKGVLPEYEAMCIHLAEGKCVALEVKCIDPTLNAVCEFRKLCGTRDPEVCRQLYPDTIRGLFGKSVVHNAIHCTDLPEDGVLEVEYFFKLLTQGSKE